LLLLLIEGCVIEVSPNLCFYFGAKQSYSVLISTVM
jgi:hypothetical protein